MKLEKKKFEDVKKELTNALDVNPDGIELLNKRVEKAAKKASEPLDKARIAAVYYEFVCQRISASFKKSGLSEDAISSDALYVANYMGLAALSIVFPKQSAIWELQPMGA